MKKTMKKVKVALVAVVVIIGLAWAGGYVSGSFGLTSKGKQSISKGIDKAEHSVKNYVAK